ncbi:MAG: hypothetical protein ACJA1A_000770 [Saprospiraceae bacterium]|jgi:hypothetical protein
MSKAKMTYEEMISKLQAQTYSAPDRWEGIEADLELNDQVSQLKTHKAPTDLWDKIGAELDTIPVAIEVIPEKFRIHPRIYLLAVIVALVGLIIWMTPKKNDLEISYSSEVVESVSASKPIEGPVNNEFLEAINFIDHNDFLYTAKDKLDYEKQMAKLEEAEKEIRLMQEQYGADKNSQKMLAKIEREKAELIKSMIKGA